MRLKSFTTVVIRIIGMMSIIYGLMTIIFILLTLSMFSDLASGGRLSGMGSIIWLQLLLPILMFVIGIILIAASRSLANLLSGGLED